MKCHACSGLWELTNQSRHGCLKVTGTKAERSDWGWIENSSVNLKTRITWDLGTGSVGPYLRESEKASTPNLDRQYPPPVRDSLPKILATFTTLPLAFFSRGRNWRVTSMTPIRFTSRTFVKSSSCIHSVGPIGTDLPALFTKPHRPAQERNQLLYSCHQNLD